LGWSLNGGSGNWAIGGQHCPFRHTSRCQIPFKRAMAHLRSVLIVVGIELRMACFTKWEWWRVVGGVRRICIVHLVVASASLCRHYVCV